MKESKFQSNLIKELKEKFDGCIVMKTDPCYKQGIPDLLILHENKWAALECKKSANAKHRPNQDYYVDRLSKFGYAAFIYPENEEEILNELQQAFES